ncbi:MAG: peroxiredoxin [Saprospiraceae bacterium]|jgi:peroxiredoxin
MQIKSQQMDIDSSILSEMITNKNTSLKKMSEHKPVLLVFLRRFGCTFCREALDDLSKIRPKIEEKGVEIVFVHMADNETAEDYFKTYKLPNSIHISDEPAKFYKEFDLFRGNIRQLFGLGVMMRGFKLAMEKGYGIGFIGDGFQMPGIFLLRNSKIVNSYIHDTAADKPDYFEIATCEF